jgi:PEP-CTERM motif
MTQISRHVLSAASALACAIGLSAPAHAQFVATICNDIQCTGGDDVIVQDNAAGDSVGMPGAMSFSTAAFGYSFLVNTSQSKPIVGSPTAPQLDLTFTATSNGAAGNVFLYASDTNFTLAGPLSALLTIGGTHSSGSGTVTGRAWGGTSNTALQFSGANLINSLVGLTGPTFSGSVTSAFASVVNPYSLTIGTQITRASAGTSTGDLNLQVSVIPEPSTWALTLMAAAFVGFVARRRRWR